MSRGRERFDPDEPLQVATFVVGSELFGLDIMRIREIVRPMPVTPVPKAPAGMRGVVNLRGRVIPVVDVGARFGRGASRAPGADARFLIITLDGRYVALLVDEVREMVHAHRRDVRLAKSALAGDAARFFVGVLSAAEKLVLLLNVRRLFEDVAAVDIGALVVAPDIDAPRVEEKIP